MTRERQGTVQVHVEQCRPWIKIVSNTSYGGVAQCDFSSDFQSTCSGKSSGVNCWGSHTIWFYNRIFINKT